MMPEDLPACLCGDRVYNPGGGQFGGGHSSQWFTCRACRRECIVVTHYMSVLVFPTVAVSGKEFPQEGLDYINGPLDITMRAYGKAIEQARVAIDESEWDLHCDLNGIPHGTVYKSKRVEPYARYLERPDGSEVEDPNVLKRLDTMYDERRHVNLATVILPPTPPQMPSSLTLYIRVNKNWKLVDRELSVVLAVPPDPRRVAHDEYFGGFFTKLREAGFKLLRPTEIPNRYYNDRNNSEPWYVFDHGDKKFTVGPRKRVINITVESAEPISTHALKELADRDNVTYEADGGWKSDLAYAKKITIHAWGGDKFVEYLTAAMDL